MSPHPSRTTIGTINSGDRRFIESLDLQDLDAPWTHEPVLPKSFISNASVFRFMERHGRLAVRWCILGCRGVFWLDEKDLGANGGEEPFRAFPARRVRVGLPEGAALHEDPRPGDWTGQR